MTSKKNSRIIRNQPEELAETLRASRKAQIEEVAKRTDATPVPPRGKFIKNHR